MTLRAIMLHHGVVTRREQCVDGSLARTRSAPAPLNMIGSAAAASTPGLDSTISASDHGQSQGLACGLSRTFTRQFSQPIVFSSDSDDDDTAATTAAEATAAAAAITAAAAAPLQKTGVYRTELQEIVDLNVTNGYAFAEQNCDGDSPQRWLLIGEDARVRAALESRGASVTTVTIETWHNSIINNNHDNDNNNDSALPSEQQHQANYKSSTDWIGEVVNTRGAAWDGVALCDTLPLAVPLPDSAASLMHRDDAASSSSRCVVHAAEMAADLLVATIRAIVSGGGGPSNSGATSGSGSFGAATQLLVCTSGAFSALAGHPATADGRKKMSVTHAPLAAVCRVANADHPEKLRCAVLDLQPETASVPPAALDALFGGTIPDNCGRDANVGDTGIGTSEDEVIVIADRVYIPRIRRFSLDDDDTDPSNFDDQRRQPPAIPLSRVFRPQACCVITGGTGRDLYFHYIFCTCTYFERLNHVFFCCSYLYLSLEIRPSHIQKSS